MVHRARHGKHALEVKTKEPIALAIGISAYWRLELQPASARVLPTGRRSTTPPSTPDGRAARGLETLPAALTWGRGIQRDGQQSTAQRSDQALGGASPPVQRLGRCADHRPAGGRVTGGPLRRF